MQTIPALTLDRFQKSADAVIFYAQRSQVWPGTEPPGPAVPAPEGWVGFTGRASHAQLAGLARTLDALGAGRGGTLAILADTSPMWAACDLANLCLGGVTVGVYPNLLGPDVAYQLRHSEARVLVVQDRAQYDKIAPHLGELPELRAVVSMEPGAPCPQLLPGEPDLAFLAARAAEVQLDDTVTLIYTSGTTGHPKGVILTHRVIMDTIRIVHKVFAMNPGDRGLIFLPFAHILQRYALYQGLAFGAEGWYCPTLQDMPKVLPQARPHAMATVPRFLEKVKAGAEARAAERGPRASKILGWAVGVGKAHAAALREGYVPLGLRLQHALADRLILSKIRARLGGSLRHIVSGGAALNPDVNAWWEGLGIKVREVWGLTECCGPATLVRLDEWRPGTVGRPLPEVEVRLDADGEVQIRGPNLFRGYYRDPDATAAAMTPDGFFRTGDIGRIDADGFLKIVDRKKEILVTAGGKNIPPVNIEKKLEGGLLGQAVVIGNDRPYLVALLAPDPDVLAATARERGWEGDYAALARRPEVYAAFQARVEEVNRGLASFETIKRFAVLPAPLTPETGELTPTLKLKRRVISERYATEIEALYQGPDRGDR